MALETLAAKVFAFCYGSLYLALFLLTAYTSRSNFRKLSPAAKKELANAREKLWNLDKRPFGLDHRFCVLSNSTKLHYVETASDEPTGNLVIFVHGFPDSWAIWKQYLANSRLCSKAKLLAVDLPGFGGSDGLDNYGPNQVLGALAEFIIKMRELHLSEENGKCVLVGHDWGAVIGFRLAEEAALLADRFIMSNGPHIPVARSNIMTKVSSAHQMMKTWFGSPFNLRPMRGAVRNIAPVARQLLLSGYIFVFNLPLVLVNVLANTGDLWLLRLTNGFSAGLDVSKPLGGSHGAEMLASSAGPSLRECSAGSRPELAYSESVRNRANNGGFVDKVRLYRDGLASQRWEKSLETLWSLSQISQKATGRRRSSSSTALFDTGPKGSLGAPTTIIWGKKDVALDRSVNVEGFREYLAPRSQVIMIGSCGHWAPLDKQAVAIFDKTIQWAVTGEKVPLKDVLSDHFPLAEIATER